MRGHRSIDIFLALGAFILFLAFLFFSLSSSNLVSGASSSASFVSKVNIEKYFSIALSDNLSTGIDFGTASGGTTLTVAALLNNDTLTNGTDYFISVSPDSNVPVDLCIKANNHLLSTSGAFFGVGNETWSSSNSSNDSAPSGPFGAIPLSLSYTPALLYVSANQSAYFRFWLDVPLNVVEGAYNNSLSFEGVSTGLGC